MATSGLKTLHQIDQAIRQARQSVSNASELPSRTSAALADVQRQQTAAYAQIATDRLDLIEDGKGGDLGYVDRQAEKLLAEHAAAEAEMAGKVSDSLTHIEKLEADRRKAETAAQKAIDAYDKAAAAAEAKILKDPDYVAQIARVEEVESMTVRAAEKLDVTQDDEVEKGTPYREDAFFNYLQKRQYGTKHAKGWFLTKALDGWVARKINYLEAAQNYNRLRAIPERLEKHLERLEAQAESERQALQTLEANILEREGVSEAREASLSAQAKLDEIDAAIAEAEHAHQVLLSEQAALASGQAGPHRKAVNLMTDALSRQNRRGLKRLAAQTMTRADDEAIDDLRDLAKTAHELEEDQKEARALLQQYQKTLLELEQVRRQFKSRRYDAPSSVFDREDLLGAMIGQVLAGLLSGNDLWRQIQRAQKTIRRYSDSDFGGIDWTEGLRLPRGNSGGWGGGWPTGGNWPSGGSRWPSTRSRKRTSIPRMPRQSLPKISLPKSGGFGGGSFGKGRRGGGFRTGGGF